MTGLETSVDEVLNVDLSATRFIHLRHPGEQNFIRLARLDEATLDVLRQLTAKGFLAYKFANEAQAMTSFVSAATAASFWTKTPGLDIREHGGVAYRLDLPANGPARRLLVIFSSMSATDQVFEAGFSARYFAPNMRQARKYMPWDTAILRIADLGGVVGAFYTDTIGQPDNEARVSALVAKVIADLAISHNNVVLYGASKGASGALLHSLRLGLNLVCVEPILADDYYVRTHRDSHFTQGLFPQDKRELFTHLLSTTEDDASRIVILSRRSPQYPYIRQVAMDSLMAPRIGFIDVQDPAIQDHPDVSPATLGLQVTLLTQMLCATRPGPEQLDAFRTVSRP